MRIISRFLLSLILWLSVFMSRSAGQPSSGQVTYIQQHIIEIIGSTDYQGELHFQGGKTHYGYATIPQTRAQRDTVDAQGNRYAIPFMTIGIQRTGNEVYADYAAKELIVAERVKGETFIYNDTLPGIQWELINEKKAIGNFTCQKAVGTFRGRTYDAWFTPDIPLPYGPWKLGGLPGLILEATTRDGELSFLFEQIAIPAEGDVEITPPSKGVRFADFKTFREEADKFVEESNKAAQIKFEKMIRERAPDANARIGMPRTLRFLIEKTLN
ncbi:GLPGLI family protein [Parapedobacter sp. ISTM3]|uniref:GLPGLI family protein n=1 Tax=Parapedobacter sp. ISTM3 TaxID=2800130 RepID=UPI001905AD72|nr:GLPGLI family protein [Parapedobacter sp. ISTM3]MBK1439170.1 GLPGLI family protein [Parapedobacter sp. ISTM3]